MKKNNQPAMIPEEIKKKIELIVSHKTPVELRPEFRTTLEQGYSLASSELKEAQKHYAEYKKLDNEFNEKLQSEIKALKDENTRLKDMVSAAHAVGYQHGYNAGSNHDASEMTANKSWFKFETENNL